MKKTTEHKRVVYTVTKVQKEAPGVSSLFLTGADLRAPAFSPGQFINVFFPETNTPEGKAYSVSSPPGEDSFSITVRAIGEFSHRLCGMKAGDTVEASLPYGFFRPEYDHTDLVLLAAGIGITPFRSIVFAALKKNPNRRIALLHSVRREDDAVFRGEFEALTSSFPNVSFSYFITRADAVSEGVNARRMGAVDALTFVSRPGDTEFLICGSIPFTRDMWRELRGQGVSEDAIYTEAFFSH